MLGENGVDKPGIVEHVSTLGLETNDLQQTSLQLRKLIIDEWSGSNKSFYENFL